MVKTNFSVTAHLVVKNDDQWVWYAINSVLPYVKQFFITDTGSTDQTIKLIHTVASPKIIFNKYQIKSPADLVGVRRQQLAKTRTDWLWLLDADEIYPKKLCAEILRHLDSRLVGIVVRRFDALGDIYHYQPNEAVGGYTMFGKTAHFSLRLVNLKIPGLKLEGVYPNEGFVDQTKTPLVAYPQSRFFITSGRYLHTTYLKRSSLGANLRGTHHRHKYKIEMGKLLPKSLIPEILKVPAPIYVPRPGRRSLNYRILAGLATPLKVVKRKFIR